MAEWTEVEDVTKLKKGDTVRAFQGTFDRVESVVDQDDEGDLYAPRVGFFSNTWTGEGNWNDHWTRLEVKSVMPTEPGTYMVQNRSFVFELTEAGDWIHENTKYRDDDVLRRWAPLHRMYSQEEVDALVEAARRGDEWRDE